MLDPPPARDIYAITPTTSLTPPAQRFLELSVDNIRRWHRAVAKRPSQGMRLFDAAVEADDLIEAAYRRLAKAERSEHGKQSVGPPWPGNPDPPPDIDAGRSTE